MWVLRVAVVVFRVALAIGLPVSSRMIDRVIDLVVARGFKIVRGA